MADLSLRGDGVQIVHASFGSVQAGRGARLSSGLTVDRRHGRCLHVHLIGVDRGELVGCLGLNLRLCLVGSGDQLLSTQLLDYLRVGRSELTGSISDITGYAIAL